MSREAETERYLQTGDHDLVFSAWPGGNLFERTRNGDDALRTALIAEVTRRTPHATVPAELADLDVVAFARAKLIPMVRGLFPRREQDPVLAVLSHSLVFLSPANIQTVLREQRWLGTAWDLANLYLGSFGAELLAADAPRILGLGEETKCYVSIEYLHGGDSRVSDVVVHEAAHVFHNCKRRTMGLRETRRREWPLELAYAKRETFAYACEAYSRFLELGRTPTERRSLLEELATGSMPPDDRVDAAEFVEILRDALSARNGWKRILARCAAPRFARMTRRSDQPSASESASES